MLAAATATVVGVAGQLSAATNVASSVVPIVPCRLLDTRVSPDTVGSRSTPIGAGEAATFLVWGTNGNCTIPNTATGIAANVTTVNGTANSFLTVFPADATRPLTSNQNWLIGDSANPNQLSVGLSATGEIKVFNQFGTVDVIVDIFGYLVAAGGAPAPSAAYDSDTAGTTAEVQEDFADFTGGTLIRDLTLPAGSYDIKATTSVRGALDGPDAPELNTRVRCNLVNATGTPANLDTFYQDFFQPDEPSPGFREDLEVGALVTFTVQTKVELRCYSIRPGGGDGDGQVPSSKIIATQVGAITAGH